MYNDQAKWGFKTYKTLLCGSKSLAITDNFTKSRSCATLTSLVELYSAWPHHGGVLLAIHATMRANQLSHFESVV